MVRKCDPAASGVVGRDPELLGAHSTNVRADEVKGTVTGEVTDEEKASFEHLTSVGIVVESAFVSVRVEILTPGPSDDRLLAARSSLRSDPLGVGRNAAWSVGRPSTCGTARQCRNGADQSSSLPQPHKSECTATREILLVASSIAK